MDTDFPNDVPEQPGMPAESLREYLAVSSLVFTRSEFHRGFQKHGINGDSHGNDPNVAERQKTPVCGMERVPVSCTASGHPHILVDPCVSTQLWSSPGRPCSWKGSAAQPLGCILLPSSDGRVLKGAEQLSSFVFQTCSADDRRHPEPSLRAAELTAGPALARRLPVAYRCASLAEMQTYPPPQVVSPWARASQMLWPFPLELVCQKVLPRGGIHSVVSACPPHMLP